MLGSVGFLKMDKNKLVPESQTPVVQDHGPPVDKAAGETLDGAPSHFDKVAAPGVC